MKTKLIRTSIQLSPALVKQIQQLANHRGVSFAEIVRRALREYYVTETIDAGRWDDEKN